MIESPSSGNRGAKQQPDTVYEGLVDITLPQKMKKSASGLRRSMSMHGLGSFT